MSNASENRKCEFEVLMSCMHQKNFDIAYKSKVDSDLLIINQCDQDGYDEIEVNGHTWRMISTTERGLAKSRNMAIINANGEICIFADDDQQFEKDYQSKIVQSFSKLDADIIVFNVKRKGSTRQEKYYSFQKIKRLPRGRGFSSCAMSFKLNKIREKKLSFNESFGSGTKWGAGEDTLFIRDLHKNGIKAYGHPEVISEIVYGESQWFSGFDEKYYYNSGAFWQAYYGKNSIMRELRFLYNAFKPKIKSRLSATEKIKLLHKGAKGFKKDISYSEYKDENSFADK